MIIKKIGFACKISKINQKNEIVSIPEFNTKTTTIAWLNRQSKKIAEQKLLELIQHNLDATYKAVTYVSTLDPVFRLFRLTSDILPVYTHEDWSYFYRSDKIQNLLQQRFSKIGDLARQHDVRLSFHPGQFCVLASDRPDVVENSIAEFEYHADMARWMGYGKRFQDMKINVHVSGKFGAAGFRAAYFKLSDVAKNCITIENDEHVFGLDECLDLIDLCPIVLDIHHHWVKTSEYIAAEDPRIALVLQSWRGVVPTIHYSNSQESIWSNDYSNSLPDHSFLLESGIKRGKLRAHSDFYINKELNRWALSHLSWADIMCEAKGKNLAVQKLYEDLK